MNTSTDLYTLIYLSVIFFTCLVYTILMHLSVTRRVLDFIKTEHMLYFCSANLFLLSYYLDSSAEVVLIVATGFVAAFYGYYGSKLSRDQKKSIITTESASILLAWVLGLLLCCRVGDLLNLYLAMELCSIAFFALVAYRLQLGNRKAFLESLIKYFIFSSLLTCMYLMGSALVYAKSGSIDFSQIFGRSDSIFTKIGQVLIVLALCGKLAAAPFHFWGPALYKHSSYFIVMLSSGLGSFALIIALFNLITHTYDTSSIHFIGILSLIIGGVGGVKQNNIRTLLAYSGISQIGFILTASYKDNMGVVLNYGFIYMICGVIPLALIMLLLRLKWKDYVLLSDLSTLGRRFPLPAIAITILFLSIAGLPPFAGFFTKFIIIERMIESKHMFSALIMLLVSIISCSYYIRLISYIFFKNSETNEYSDTASHTATRFTGVLLNSIALITILFLCTYFYYYKAILSWFCN